ncbi:ATP-binding protein [uncultured Sphingomonas sp.]|uniref:ATP-binding protein n=1 Tax=uncultured Sphingomonas sp. TaxID=158754 RepID=UPI0025ECACFF|nr:ATP-binding protein [uncultured Sphingomonas sp.]
MNEAPLLALTRKRAFGPSLHATAAENMRQLVQLRWIAVAGQLLTILIVGPGLGVPLPLGTMLLVIATLVMVNLLALLAMTRHAITNIDLMFALLFDVGSLSLQLYLSGGATNPFISLYLIQIALGVILLETWSVWILVAVASVSYAMLTVRYRPLLLPRRLLPAAADVHTLGSWLSFTLVATLLVLFMARISHNLRARDTYLADLRQQAAEQDGIVRMGLFASGAAHELGTPLASIAVILADWRRMPALVGDETLRGEIEEMQAEIRRCKSIVSDILHSAGEPRGDAMGKLSVRAFLHEAAAAWAATQPGVALTYQADAIGDATVVAEPALRQALWSLLDNAAEVSPDRVALQARRDAAELVIAVRDQGPGFPPTLLADVGKLYHSSKGAGHGVGLFLASNVARRLGGRLEAYNRNPGAEVRLILPLVSGDGKAR